MNELVYGTTPFGFQRAIVEETWQKPYWGLFMEMGTGKSKIVIDTFVNLHLIGEVDTILYVAKKGELSNFQIYEVPKHKPKHIDCTGLIYSGYHISSEVQKIKHILHPQNHLRLFSINIEALRSGKGFEIAKAYMRSSKKTMLIVDESTTLKDRRSSQHKAIKALRAYAKYVRLMTGTVMPHNPVDVYCQSIIMNKHALGYGGVTAFKSDFHETEKKHFGNRVFNSMVGVKNLDMLRQKMKRIGTVMKKTDCLDLPPKIYRPHHVPLTGEQAQHYQNLVDYMVTQVNDEYIPCANALSVILRLHQIVCGQLRTPEGNYHLINTDRIQATKELVDEILENEEKVIIWSHFRAVSEALAKHLRQSYGLVHLYGGLSTPDRAAMIHEFKTSKTCRIFLGNPQSSGFGLTLTEANTAIYYSNSDNYEHRLQSEDRIHRIGQDKKCLYIDLHTKGTVEDAILNRGQMKALNRDQLMKTDEFIKMITLTGRT